MRQTLRRSCAACAKSKHSCDLRTPRCSRCLKRKILCVYANEPLTAQPSPGSSREGSQDGGQAALVAHETHEFPSAHILGSLDPFESYPQTRLPRSHVQRLIHSFLNKIAFQYYPLDLNAGTNPFLVSWWPLALGDPALFHVSLQTASLDEELAAQNGFETSERLMADSVALLRRKVQSPSLAVQDGTLNSVITLAAIEFGKGNVETANLHIEGAKKLVDLRGGIWSVRQTSPLTARMVSWVSMILTGQAHFTTQEDGNTGRGIPPIPEWSAGPDTPDADDEHDGIYKDLDPSVYNVLTRLRKVFRRAQQTPFSNTQIHELACFVIHRLLPTAATEPDQPTSPLSECIRCAIILYMLAIQGPTYFSHAFIQHMTVTKLFEQMQRQDHVQLGGHLAVWLVTIGMASSAFTEAYGWFTSQAQNMTATEPLASWNDVAYRLKGVLWLDTPRNNAMFRCHWAFLAGENPNT